MSSSQLRPASGLAIRPTTRTGTGPGLGTDPRSDIYALAATLYHLLTNVKPPDAPVAPGPVVNGQLDPLIPANEVAT